MAEVSVVVAICNVEAFLPKCIESLRRQDHHDVEFILVDDGSTDRSTDLAVAAAEQDPRFSYTRQDNRGPGPGGARNGGLDVASGEYLMFVDGDDVLPSTAVSALVAPLHDDPSVALATGGVARLRGAQILPSRLHDRSHQVTRTTRLAQAPELVFDPTAWNKLFRRSFFDEVVGGYPEKMLYEDMVASMRAFRSAHQIAVLRDVVYFWRIRRDGSSITQAHLQWRDQLDRFEELKRLDELLVGDTELSHVKEAHDWKVAAIDLAYTFRLLLELPSDEGEAFFAEVQKLVTTLGLEVDDWLSAEARARLASTRHGTFRRCRELLAAETGMIRPDRRSMQQARRGTVDGRPVVQGVWQRGESFRLVATAARGVEGPSFVLSSPVPLAGSPTVSHQVDARRRGGHLVSRVSFAELAQHHGDIHLAMTAEHSGTEIWSEVERSNLERAAQVLGRRSVVDIGSGQRLTWFFEDGKLHFGSCVPDLEITSVRVVDTELTVAMWVATNQRVPSHLYFAGSDSIHDAVAAHSGFDGTTHTYTIAKRRLIGQNAAHSWIIGAVDDADDPCPKPVCIGPAALGRTRSGTWLLSVTCVERAQARLSFNRATALIGRLPRNRIRSRTLLRLRAALMQ